MFISRIIPRSSISSPEFLFILELKSIIFISMLSVDVTPHPNLVNVIVNRFVQD
jgi:hypothetical protein